MFHAFFLWWTAQLREILPRSWRASGAIQTDALIVEPEGAMSRVALSVRRRGRVSDIGRFSLAPADAAALAGVAARPGLPAARIRLAPGLFLQKDLSLPLAAEHDMARILRHEMDRETPFDIDELWWSASILGRDLSRGSIAVELCLVPRADLAPMLTALAAAGLRPIGIEAATESGECRWLPLEAASSERWRRLTPTAALAGTCAVLAVIAAGLPFARLALAEQAEDSRIAALAPQVAQAEAARRRLSGAGTGSEVIAAERAHMGDVLQILAAVTEAMPDDTYLSDLTLHQRQIAITGRSADAAKLIGALAAIPVFKDPAFSAPVTRIKESGTDIFSVKAEVRP